MNYMKENDFDNDEFDELDQEDFLHMEEFNHPHFEQMGVTPERFIKLMCKLITHEQNLDIQIETIILQAGRQSLLEGFECIDYKAADDLSDTELKNKFETLIEFIKNKKVFGENHDIIENDLHNFFEFIIPLTDIMDHTRVTYGTSGLHFHHSGIDDFKMLQSDQPLLAATAIFGSNGLNRWDPCFVFRKFSQNENEDEVSLLMLINDPNIVIDPKTLIFTQKTGSSTGEIQTMYNDYNFAKMPSGFKRDIKDVCKINENWIVSLNMVENKVKHDFVPAHLTSECAAPDFLIFNQVKNGHEHDIGLRLKIQRAYNSEKAPPFGPKKSPEGVVKPLCAQLIIKLYTECLNSIPTTTDLNSSHKVGNFMSASMQNAEFYSSFLKKCTLIDIDTIPNILKSRKPVGAPAAIAALKKLQQENFFQNYSSKKFECPHHLCDDQFSKKEEQVYHSLHDCEYFIKFPETRNKLFQKIELYKANQFENEKKGKQYLRKNKNKMFNLKFNCPAAESCTFSRSSWRQSAKSIADHITPGTQKSCQHINSAEILFLFKNHPLFVHV